MYKEQDSGLPSRGYREDLSQSLFDRDFEETNRILNLAIKNDSIPSEEYSRLTNKAKKEGFKFSKHFNLL